MEGHEQIEKFVKDHFYAHHQGGAIVVIGYMNTYSLGRRVMVETSMGIIQPLTKDAVQGFYEVDEERFNKEQGKAKRVS